MERGTKRKAALAASPTTESRASKRQKTPEPRSVQSTGGAQTNVQQVGVRWIEQVRKARDSSSNPIATEFLSLPARDDFPDYYSAIALPIAVDTIEDKVNAGEYPDISAIESDIKRMVFNAKEYNEPGSAIFQNAERVRKMTHNFMKVHNPAYKDASYQARPTPLPDDTPVAKPKPVAVNSIRLTTGSGRASSGAAQVVTPSARATPTPKAPSITIARKSESAAPTDLDGAADSVDYVPPQSFDGKTFQQAQEQIMDEMIRYKDEGGDVAVFLPFVNLPSRKIVDYYQTIKEPMSLTGVKKKVKGVHGRLEVTGVSDFRTWDALELEVKKIWDNARIYNEDGSDINELSKELEQVFKARLAEAKKVVSEPPPPTLKLSVAKPAPTPGLRLSFNNPQKASPVPTSVNPSVSVDESALQRQQQAVKAGSGVTPQVNGDSTARASSRPPSQGSTVNGVKSEGIPPSEPTSATSMQPTMAPPPVPNGLPQPNGTPAPTPTTTSTHQVPPVSSFDNKFRLPGRDASTALISTLQIVTSPVLGLPNPLSVTVPADDTLTQQSVTLNLAPTHTHLQLLPTIAPAVTNNPKRPYRLFVTANGTRISPSHNAFRPPSTGLGMVNGDSGMAIANEAPALSPSASAPTSTPASGPHGPVQPPQVFDVKLAGSGVHRIEVECVAVAEGALGAGTLAGKGGLEMERMGVYVNVLKG